MGTALIVEKNKLQHNINIIKNMTSSKIIAVLKSKGYGLGLVRFAELLVENGIDMFAVSRIEDAIALTDAGLLGKVLLLTPVNFYDEAKIVIKNKIIPSIGSVSSALVMDETAKNLNEVIDFHLKIDTGFGRFGISTDDIEGFCTLLKSKKHLQLSGTYSHFSFSFSNKEKDTYTQYNKFINSIELIKNNGFCPGTLHICNSAAFLRYPKMHLDAVRIGSAFLGRILIENTYGLEKIGYLKSRIIEIKEVPKSYSIGYANLYKTPRALKIGIVPVGYIDGFGLEKSKDTFRSIDILRYIYNDLKSFNKKLYVSMKGQDLPVLGRVNTCNIIIDLTKIEASIGDEVRLDINTMYVPLNIPRNYI
jgi:alanine racemase